MKIKLNEISLSVWIILATLVMGGIAVLLITRKRKIWTTQLLSHGAICIAMSFVLSYIRLFKMPMGGSVTPASMLPVMAFSYLYGITPGLLVCIVYSILQFIQNPVFVSVAQVLLDYLLAFGGLALAGLGRLLWKDEKAGSGKEFVSWLLGIVAALLMRYICSVLSGYIYFADYAISEGMAPLAYSLGYNCYVLIEGIICIAIIAIPSVRKVLRKVSCASLGTAAGKKSFHPISQK